MAGEPGEPRGVLDHERERRLVAPRPVEPEARHPEHDQVRPFAPERLVVDAQLVQHAGRVVLDHHVARRHEPAEEIDAALVSEVERQALLVGVERGEDRSPLPVRGPRSGAPHRPVGLRPAGSTIRGGSPPLRAARARGWRGVPPRTRSCRGPGGLRTGRPAAPRPCGARCPAVAGRRRSSAARAEEQARVPGGVRAASRKGGRGFAAPSVGLAANVPRSRKCSKVVTFSPLAIGALGMRKAEARSSTSSTACAGDPCVDRRRQGRAVQESASGPPSTRDGRPGRRSRATAARSRRRARPDRRSPRPRRASGRSGGVASADPAGR